MRIVIANHTGAIVGGAESYLAQLSKRAVGMGLHFRFLFEGSASGRPSIDQGFDVVAWKWSPDDGRRILDEIEEWSPDIVYVHGLYDHDLERHLTERWPSILFAHNYYGTCVTGEKRHSFPRNVACKRTLGLGCFAYCYTRGCGSMNPVRLISSYKTQRRRQEGLHGYRRILVASHAMREEFLRQGSDVEQTIVLPLFVEPNGSPPSRGDRNGPVTFVGRLTRVKGIAVLIEAIAAVKLRRRGVALVVVGDGPERENAMRLAKTVGVEARFTGWVNSEEKNALIDESSVLAIPSLWPEPFALVGLEAAIRGRPSVAFAVGGIPDWLQREVTGEMPDAGDFTSQGFADALERALGDQGHYDDLCRNAHQRALQFGAAPHLSALRRIFEEVLSEARG